MRFDTAVLILPYRPALPTAKAIATIQELSAERLELGVGVGWISDEVLTFLHAAFGAPDDVAISNQ